MIYAVIDDVTNVVVNTIVLDEGAQWTPPDNDYLVNIDGLEVGIGWSYDPQTQQWTPPPEPPINEINGSAPNVIG